MIMEKVLWKYEPVTVPQISKLVQNTALAGVEVKKPTKLFWANPPCYKCRKGTA